MICLRCGYCCVRLFIAPDLSEFPLLDQPCKFLRYKKDKAICEIHDDEIFKDSSCERYQQIGAPGAPCRMGHYIKTEHPEMIDEYRRLVDESREGRQKETKES